MGVVVIIKSEVIINKHNLRQVRTSLVLICLYVMILRNRAECSTAEFMSEEKSRFDDEHLLKLIIAGDHSAFSELVIRHTKKYYSIAYRVLFNRDDAEDLVQEAFLKIWKNPENWNSSHNVKFTTWFYRVVINLCLDYKKKNKFSISDNFNEIESHMNIQDGIIDIKRRQELLDRYLLKLPERQQIAFFVKFHHSVHQHFLFFCRKLCTYFRKMILKMFFCKETRRKMTNHNSYKQNIHNYRNK